MKFVIVFIFLVLLSSCGGSAQKDAINLSIASMNHGYNCAEDGLTIEDCEAKLNAIIVKALVN